MTGRAAARDHWPSAGTQLKAARIMIISGFSSPGAGTQLNLKVDSEAHDSEVTVVGPVPELDT